jgi:CRISPR-associated endoribonuclease Cas6
MLVSWVISLQPTEAVSTSPNLGREAHAWFLNQVRRADPALADELHHGEALRPFTVSNLWPLDWRRWDEVILSPETTYALRMTSFSPRLSTLLREHVIPHTPEALSLGRATLRVTGSTTDPAAHAWAGEDTFEGLVQRHTLAPHVPHRVSLRFASPTLFRSADKNVPLPLPGLVFGGLLDKWNAFAPLQVHPEARRFADECLAISRYRLETAAVAFGDDGRRGVVAGFVGACSYAMQVRDRYWMGLIHLLAAFAFYAGLGRRTTMGLGQARALPERS